jgi:hypothetical protein
MEAVGRQGRAGRHAILESSVSMAEVANMWTRRLLLATMVAAAAMSLPRQLPAVGTGQSAHNIATNSFR